jgi:hypothetical protein
MNLSVLCLLHLEIHSWVGEGGNLGLGLFCGTSNLATGANVQAPAHLRWDRAAYRIAAFCKLFAVMSVDCAVSGYKCVCVLQTENQVFG